MYAKGKGSSVPSDSQAREKYVCRNETKRKGRKRITAGGWEGGGARKIDCTIVKSPPAIDRSVTPFFSSILLTPLLLLLPSFPPSRIPSSPRPPPLLFSRAVSPLPPRRFPFLLDVAGFFRLERVLRVYRNQRTRFVGLIQFTDG